MSKMGSHDPFGHLQHKLWPKERSGVKLAIWLPTMGSRWRCNMPLESSRRGLKLWFRLHPDWSSTVEIIVLQSCRTSSLGKFETPIWESRNKKPFRCHSRRVVQSILYGGRWWLPLSLGCGESCESRVARDLS
jgi:hypothetical protein